MFRVCTWHTMARDLPEIWYWHFTNFCTPSAQLFVICLTSYSNEVEIAMKTNNVCVLVCFYHGIYFSWRCLASLTPFWTRAVTAVCLGCSSAFLLLFSNILRHLPKYSLSTFCPDARTIYGICTIKSFNPLLLQRSTFRPLYTRTPFSCLWQKVECVNGAAYKWDCRSVNWKAKHKVIKTYEQDAMFIWTHTYPSFWVINQDWFIHIKADFIHACLETAAKGRNKIHGGTWTKIQMPANYSRCFQTPLSSFTSIFAFHW